MDLAESGCIGILSHAMTASRGMTVLCTSSPGLPDGETEVRHPRACHGDPIVLELKILGLPCPSLLIGFDRQASWAMTHGYQFSFNNSFCLYL